MAHLCVLYHHLTHDILSSYLPSSLGRRVTGVIIPLRKTDYLKLIHQL